MPRAPRRFARSSSGISKASRVLTVAEREEYLETDVAIIGGGFSGAALAIQLLRRAERKISIALIGREARMGCGVAYRTACETHLLNVPAGRMSVLPGEPAHFTAWLAEAKQMRDVDSSFLPRSIYGDYVEDTLKTARQQSTAGVFTHLLDTVTSLDPAGGVCKVRCGSGATLLARQVVLATGNYPPPDPPEMRGLPGRTYISYPWAANALDGIGPDETLLFLGSGLTAIDQVLSLTARGFKGMIFLLSSRGLLPQSHRASPPWPLDTAGLGTTSTRTLFATVRLEMERAAADGADWRSVVDSLRPHAQSIWNALPSEEKRRFLRHLRSLWDVCRHRVPPAAHERIAELIAKERLKVIAGRCTSAEQQASCAFVTFRPRGSAIEDFLTVERIINCTGPSAISRLYSDPLLRSLVESGVGRLDPIGIGLDTDVRGALYDGAGRVHGNLFALGPLRKGSLWETTAVPEIRMQAQTLADHLLALG